MYVWLNQGIITSFTLLSDTRDNLVSKVKPGLDNFSLGSVGDPAHGTGNNGGLKEV